MKTVVRFILFVEALLCLATAELRATPEAKPSASADASTPAPERREESPRGAALELLAKAGRAAEAIEYRARAAVLRQLAEAQFIAGDQEGFRKSVASAHAAALAVQSSLQGQSNSGHALGALALMLIDLGDVERAKMPTYAIRDSISRNVTLQRLGQAQAEAADVAGAQETAGKIWGDQGAPDHSAQGPVRAAIAIAQAKAGDIADSWKTIEAIKDTDAQNSALATFAAARAKAGDMDAAVQALGRIPPDSDDATTALPALYDAQRRHRQSDAATKTANKVLERAGKNGVAVVELAKVQVQRQDLAGARSSAVKLDDWYRDEALLAIVEAQARSRDLRPATATAADIQGDTRKGKALCAIVTAQIEAGDLAAAKATAEMTSSDARVKAFCLLALAQYPKDADAARDSIATARAAMSDSSGDSESPLAETYARMGDLAQAEAAADEEKWPRGKVNARRRLAVALAQAKGFEEAVRWSEKHEDRFVACVCLIDLAKERLKGPAKRP